MSRGRKLTVPPNLDPVVKEMFVRMQTSRMAVFELAEVSGVAASTLYSWTRRKSPILPNLQAAIGALGGKLTIVWDR